MMDQRSVDLDKHVDGLELLKPTCLLAAGPNENAGVTKNGPEDQEQPRPAKHVNADGEGGQTRSSGRDQPPPRQSGPGKPGFRKPDQPPAEEPEPRPGNLVWRREMVERELVSERLLQSIEVTLHRQRVRRGRI
jgi:hypothetical protein